jgi:hypothetical protein
MMKEKTTAAPGQRDTKQARVDEMWTRATNRQNTIPTGATEFGTGGAWADDIDETVEGITKGSTQNSSEDLYA